MRLGRRKPSATSPPDDMYLVDCGGGRTVWVHRDVDKAFPLLGARSQVQTQAAIEALDKVKASLDRTVEREVKTLHGVLSDANVTMLIAFRGAFEVYRTDPCNHGDLLVATVNSALAGHQAARYVQVRAIELQILHEQNASVKDLTARIVDIHNGLSLGAPETRRRTQAAGDLIDRWNREHADMRVPNGDDGK